MSSNSGSRGGGRSGEFAFDTPFDRRTLLSRAAMLSLSAGGMGLLAGCGSTSGSSSQTTGGSTGAAVSRITGAEVSEARTLDPDGPDAQYLPSLIVINACYDRLTDFVIPADLAEAQAAAKTGLVPKPLLAESWDISSDSRTFQFKLRQGVKSSAGNEMTSASVTTMVEKVLTAKAVGSFILLVGGILAPSQVKAIDDYTVEFKVADPNTLLLQVLGSPWMVIYDEKTLKQHATAKDPYAGKWLETHTAGFGPYVVESFNSGGTSVKLSTRADYWGQKYIPTVIQQSVPETSNRVELLDSGQIQFAGALTQDDLTTVAKAGGKVQHVASLSGVNMILTPKAPFDDPAVRKAIAQAMPTATIKSLLFSGSTIAQPWKSILAPIVPGYTDAYGISEDAAAAKAVLSKLNGAELSIAYSSGQPVSEQVALQVQQALSQSGGLKVTLNELPDETFVAQLAKKALPTFISNQQGIPLFPSVLYYLENNFGKAGANNYNNYLNPDIQAIIAKLQQAPPLSTVEQLADQAQKILMRDLPVVPVIYTGDVYATSQSVELTQTHTGIAFVWWQDLKAS